MGVPHSRDVAISDALRDYRRKVEEICRLIDADIAQRGLASGGSHHLLTAFDAIRSISDAVIPCDVATSQRQLRRIEKSRKITEESPFSAAKALKLVETIKSIIDQIPVYLESATRLVQPNFGPYQQVLKEEATRRVLLEYHALQSDFEEEVKIVLGAATMPPDELLLLADADLKSDPGKKHKKIRSRPMTIAATDCVRLYKTAKKRDSTVKMQGIVEEYVDKHGGSVATILRCLSDNREQWH
ncbi:MAG: hypothetical protein HY290_03950 [Planctomycetia bacterium]|nr:hypothetical protein [Planctomycetia bacterium]